MASLMRLMAAAALLSGCGAHVLPVQSPVLDELDAQKKTYYGSIATQTGAKLLKSLHTLVLKHKDLMYDPARDLMLTKLDDAKGTGVIRDVYLQREFRGIKDTKTAAIRGLNTEHTWCQSMGAGEEPMRSDLHHLFPADAGTNSQRGNKAFGEVVTIMDTLPEFLGDDLHSRTGKDAAGRDVFEPRGDHKGDVARAIFYFYAAYGVDAKAGGAIKLDNFKREHPVLLRWHLQDPVSPKEVARNEAIYKLQGNRNPFIDHPEWLAKVL
ncbi:MAG: endonuclease [Cyanobacteria bacterium RYN_339]|nr:endonuclease [Cyanobacteria bacterium RYN_339]